MWYSETPQVPVRVLWISGSSTFRASRRSSAAGMVGAGDLGILATGSPVLVSTSSTVPAEGSTSRPWKRNLRASANTRITPQGGSSTWNEPFSPDVVRGRSVYSLTIRIAAPTIGCPFLSTTRPVTGLGRSTTRSGTVAVLPG